MDSLSHEQRNWLPAYTITLCVAASVLLCIRLASRLHILKCQQTAGQFGIDDLFITIAWALSIAWSALIVICMSLPTVLRVTVH
jgi:urea transporter